MTREEEIRLTADKYCLDEYTRLGFIAGAEWADRTMIDKACEWLLEWEAHQGEDIEVVEQFKQAMKGGAL